MNKKQVISIIALVLLSLSAVAAPLYNYLCGGDEDGCVSGAPETCICVMANPQNQDICFTYEGCVPPDPLTQQCAPDQINEKTEASCLATLWQSEPTPPCVPLTQVPKPSLCATECTSLFHCQPTR